jgi:hypothetical protein
MSFLFGCAAEHDSPGQLLKKGEFGAANAPEAKSKDILIFNESSAILPKPEGTWNLRISSFEPVQAIYVDKIPMNLSGGSYDFLFKLPYVMKSDQRNFIVEVYTSEGVVKRKVVLKQKASKIAS